MRGGSYMFQPCASSSAILQSSNFIASSDSPVTFLSANQYALTCGSGVCRLHMMCARRPHIWRLETRHGPQTRKCRVTYLYDCLSIYTNFTRDLSTTAAKRAITIVITCTCMHRRFPYAQSEFKIVFTTRPEHLTPRTVAQCLQTPTSLRTLPRHLFHAR